MSDTKNCFKIVEVKEWWVNGKMNHTLRRAVDWFAEICHNKDNLDIGREDGINVVGNNNINININNNTNTNNININNNTNNININNNNNNININNNNNNNTVNRLKGNNSTFISVDNNFISVNTTNIDFISMRRQRND
jgi:hypothetical protein